MIGQMLGHYRLLEKIGAGGMGEVYRALDEHLGREVAIKILPTSALKDDLARKRFRREARTLSKLSHPHIATVYDYDTQDGVDFLVMELLRGATLAEKLAGGPLPEHEALALGLQMLAGLEEAHANGIVHGDLKPQNVFVTAQGQLKLVDFGLARSISPVDQEARTESFMETNAIRGTLPYMAPEQLRGEQVDARSDLYSAAVVLYELVSGQRPFPETNTPLLIDAILNQIPSLPSASSGRISPGFEGAILKALDKDRGHRHQTALELRIDLERSSSGTPLVIPRRPLRGRRVVAITAALAGIVILAVLIDQRKRERPPALEPTGGGPPPSASVAGRRSVAVLGFRNVSGRPGSSWLSTAFSEMLATELAAGEKVRIIPGENIARMKRELSLKEEDTFAHDTLRRIKAILGSDMIVLGAFTAIGQDGAQQIRLDVRLQDSTTGETLGASSETGSEADLFDLIARIGGRLRQTLGVADLAAAELDAVRISMPSNLEASRLYAEGLAKLRVLESQNARDLLQQAVSKEPTFPLAHAALSRAWSALDYDVRALEEAKLALDHASGLQREDRLAVEALYWQAAKKWDEAIKTLEALCVLFPDNVEYRLQLVNAQYKSGKVDDAVATVRQLQSLPPPFGDDPRIDLEEAAMAPDKERRVEAARRAVARASQSGARLLAARARILEGLALVALKRYEEAEKSYEEAKQIFSAAGDLSGLAKTLFFQAALYKITGHRDLAMKGLQQSLATYRETGSRARIAAVQNDIALILRDEGNLDGARRSFEECASLFKEVGQPGGESVALGNVAGVARNQGDVAGAKKYYDAALAIERQLGRQDGIAWALSALAVLEFYQGNLDAAKSTFQESMAACRNTGEPYCDEEGTGRLGEVLAAQGDSIGARKRYEEILPHLSEVTTTSVHVALARLAILEGRPSAAETPAREAAEYCRTHKMIDDEAEALSVLATSLWAQGKRSEAHKAAKRSAALAEKTGIMETRFAASVALARTLAADGNVKQAEALLRTTAMEAKKCAFVPHEFEARLALGEILMKAGGTETARSALQALSVEAESRGFTIVAQKASAALHI